MAAAFVTIGHSTRPLDEFLAMLTAAEVRLLLDVRRFPHSPRNPAYDIATLPAALAARGILYRHCPALGGRQKAQKGIDPATNGLWRERSFHNYADYALGPAFAAAFSELVREGARQRVALMCAEAVWWRCHRRIITDHLLLTGHAVDHLMGPGHTTPASPTPGAVLTAGGQVVYPAPALPPSSLRAPAPAAISG